VLLSLVDVFRCPAAHEESTLVLSVDAWAGQRIHTGILGCPVCTARYPIRDGHVDFSGDAGVRHGGAGAAADGLRLAAQLDLSEPGGIVLLSGRYAAAHVALGELSNVICLLVDSEVDPGPSAVSMTLLERLPLADGVLRGAALDAPRNTVAFLPEIARCVRARGRIVGISGSPRPVGIRLLAEDNAEWVGEVPDVRPTVTLRRGTRAD
jgi:uncharacterized protein YbaR (Trm112 family)